MTPDEPGRAGGLTDDEIDAFIREAHAEGESMPHPEPPTPEEIEEAHRIAEFFWPLQCEAMALMDETTEEQLAAYEAAILDTPEPTP